MSSRSLLNAALLAVVLGLILLAVYEPGMEEPQGPKPLTAVDPSTVLNLRIERPDRPPVLFQKREGLWRMLEPYQLPADSYRIRSLLNILNTPSFSQLPVGNLELERFSLAPPNASLLVGGVRIDFGGSEQINALRYVRVDDTVHLIADLFYHHLLSAAASLVDHSLLEPDTALVEIILPLHRLVLTDGRWTITPEPEGISADVIARLVAAWRRAQALEVKAIETDSADSTVSVRLADRNKPLRFLISAKENAVVFARPDTGVQYHLTEASAQQLLALDAHIPKPGATGQTATDTPDSESMPPAKP